MVGQAGASSSYASTFTVGSFSYDVFLNFRGEDTRKGFTGHLYRALHRERINVFMDNHKLWEGEEIGPKLVEAIQGSKISIPIFSKGYADSKWCLMELAQIMECHKSNHQIVLPIFFDVEPSDVRHQTGSFEEVFLKHERNFNLHIVEEWREALRKVGSLKGWDLNAVENGDESKLIELVVERALRETRSIHLSDVKYPVGLDSRVNDLLSLLNSGSKDVRFVGICGEGGIGKTTIAKALYNGILQSFHQNCFLANIREEALGPNGLVSLQEKLIYSISKRKVVGEILNVDNGKEMIKRRCQGENVLLVLDDVDHCSQLFALAVDLNWFGQGSRVIITTRDEHILNVANVDTDKIYWPKELDTNQSLELFAWHAFQKHQPFEEYMELSHQIACYSEGLPLTLEVLGSYLSDIHDKEVWKSTLQKLREIPLKEVYERLKISYDNLEDDYQKAIFLDVACFFIGWEKKCVISIWEACGYHPKSAIKKLIQRSLLKVTEEKFLSSKYYLQMHDQIRDMGREIVLQESRMESGRRSRLWSPDEILEVVEEHKGTHNIKGILLSSKRHNQLSSSGPQFPTVYISSEYFENMSGLRFLHVDGADSKGDFPRLPYGLRWFSWKRCPLKDLPANFYHKRLVHLDLSHSRIQQAWNIMPQNEYKFQNLKVLNLSFCPRLSNCPDFSWFPYLEELNLSYCIHMDDLDESIGQLSHLKNLDLTCNNINKLPESIGQLSHLKNLDLTCCNSINKLPESIGDLESILELFLEATRIEELPHSICRLSSLQKLILNECELLDRLPESIGDLKSLVELHLVDARIDELPDSVGLLEKLEELNLSGCRNLVKLPRSIGRMSCLRRVNLVDSGISKLPNDLLIVSSLVELYMSSCHEEEQFNSCPHAIPFTGFSQLQVLNLGACARLESLSADLSYLKQLQKIVLNKWEKLQYIPELPSSLTTLSCLQCKSLERLPDLSNLKSLTNLFLLNCYKLEKIQGLEGIESLESFVVIGCYNVTATPRKQYFQLVDRIDDGLERDDEPTELKIHSFVNENDGIRKGLFLIIIFAFSSNLKETLQEGELVHIELNIYTTIFGKDGNETYCQHTIILENVVFTTQRDIIYIHDLEGFTWFGFSLEGKNAMKELKIELCGIYKLSTDDYCHCRDVIFKFWSLRQYINEESGEDMLNHYALIGKLEFRFVEEVDTEWTDPYTEWLDSYSFLEEPEEDKRSAEKDRFDSHSVLEVLEEDKRGTEKIDSHSVLEEEKFSSACVDGRGSHALSS